MKLFRILSISFIIFLIQIQGYEYPETSQIEQIDNYNGIFVNDPYQWLEDSEDGQVQTWDKAQLAFYEKHQQNNSLIQPFYTKIKEFKASSKTDSYSIGNEGKIFSIYQDPELHAPIYYVQEKACSPLQLLLDVSEWPGECSVDYESPSPDGKTIAFGISRGGDEAPTLHLFNTTSLAELSDTLMGEKQENIVWTEDSMGFYYTAFPRSGEVPKTEEFLWCRVYFHVIGTDSTADFKVQGDAKLSDWWYCLMKEIDCLLIIRARQLIESGEFLTEGYSLPLSNPKAHLELTYEGTDSDDSYYKCTLKGGTYYLTNAGAANFKLIKFKGWSSKDVIAERKEILESVTEINGKIGAVYREHGHHMILIFDFNGRLQKKIPLPGPGIVEIESKRNSPFATILFQSLTQPPTLYEYNERSNLLRKVAEKEILGYHPEDYSTKLEFAKINKMYLMISRLQERC